MAEVYKIFESQPYLAGHVTCTEKSLKLKWHTVFWLSKTVPTFNDHQHAMIS